MAYAQGQAECGALKCQDLALLIAAEHRCLWRTQVKPNHIPEFFVQSLGSMANLKYVSDGASSHWQTRAYVLVT